MLDGWHDTAHWIGKVGITRISSGGVIVSLPRFQHIDTNYLLSSPDLCIMEESADIA